MARDVIICGDVRGDDALSDGSVQLVVTSPPYNVGKAYAAHDDRLPLDKYLAFLNQVWHECYRVLAPGGRLCINVADQPQALSPLTSADHDRAAAHGRRRGPELADAAS